jgi:hypothetical protein
MNLECADHCILYALGVRKGGCPGENTRAGAGDRRTQGAFGIRGSLDIIKTRYLRCALRLDNNVSKTVPDAVQVMRVAARDKSRKICRLPYIIL